MLWAFVDHLNRALHKHPLPNLKSPPAHASDLVQQVPRLHKAWVMATHLWQGYIDAKGTYWTLPLCRPPPPSNQEWGEAALRKKKKRLEALERWDMTRESDHVTCKNCLRNMAGLVEDIVACQVEDALEPEDIFGV